MNKKLLKKLIKEVIREVEDKSSSSSSKPSASTREPITTPRKPGEEPFDSSLPNVDKAEQALQALFAKPIEDETITFRIRGVKAGQNTRLGKFISDVMYKAKQDDLSLINAEIKQAGGQAIKVDGKYLTMSVSKLASSEKSSGKSQKPIKNLDPKFDFNNLEPDEQLLWAANKPETVEYLKSASPEEVIRMIDGNLPKEKKKELYRMACIRPGEKEEEWKSMTSSDMEKEREKTKRRKAKLDAGTLETDPKTGLPTDTSLWTDKEWDASTQGGEIKTAIGGGERDKGKTVYRPSFKKTDRTSGGRKVFSPIDYKKQ